MPSDMKRKWWTPALRWSVAALCVFLLAIRIIPHMAETAGHPFLAALAQHTLYLYWASGLMAVVGWVDSALLYRQQRFHRK
jgi:hypothetical protein